MLSKSDRWFLVMLQSSIIGSLSQSNFTIAIALVIMVTASVGFFINERSAA